MMTFSYLTEPTLTELVKKDTRQGLNLGFLNPSQMLLPTEPLELWHWSRGFDSQVPVDLVHL